MSQSVQLPEIRQVVKGKHKRFGSDGESSGSERELQVFDGPVEAGGSGDKGGQKAENKKKKKKRRTMDPLEGPSPFRVPAV